MWNKLAHLVRRNVENEPDNDNEQTQHNDKDASSITGTASSSVVSHVYEQLPNLSHFHSGSAVHLASPSPPASPSKGSKRNIFKRSLKAKFTSTPVAQGAQDSVLSPASFSWTSPSPANLPAKKVRASLQVDTFTAQSSTIDPAPHSAPLPSQPHTPTVAAQHSDNVFNPQVEMQPTGTGSIRSILRDPKTPGTGQSVRFFSRDVYHVISPDVSGLELDQDVPHVESEAFLEKLKLVSPERSLVEPASISTKQNFLPTNPSDNVVDMFSPPRHDSSAKSRKPLPFQPRHPPRTKNSSNDSSHSHSDSGSLSGSNSQSLSSITIPMPPEDMPSLFNISQEHELAEIPVSLEGSLQDDAIEVEDENEPDNREKISNPTGEMRMKTIRKSSQYICSPGSTSTPNQDRSAAPPRTIHSPDGTVFHSMMPSSPTEEPTKFHSFSNTTNEPTSATAFFTPNASQSKTANGTVFYTPENSRSSSASVSESNALVLAPKQTTSISSSATTDGLMAHSQEELIASLREQLSLQQQLASQFEVDLSARDELVSLLSTQLQNSEAGAEKYRKEVERRQSAMRALKRKVGELEKLCRGLEEEVERSREESFERSVMDEASEGALVVLHGSIGQLKKELEKTKEEEVIVCQERDTLKGEVEKFGEERQRFEETERDLKETVKNKTNEIKQLEERVEEESLASSQAQQTIDSLHDNVSRLEELLRKRDAEIEEQQSRIVDREQEAEQLRAQMSKMKQEHSRIADEQDRHLDEISQREKAARIEMEDAVRQKAEDEAALSSIKGRVATLTDEVDRLRRQVHDLQQESADKEVKLLQLNKSRAQDKEDMDGLNIALDSKQQELELLKRKMGVKGTGGSTPAPSRVGLPDLTSRRQSVTFATPSAPRPRPGSAAGITKSSTTEAPLKKLVSSSTSVRDSTSTAKPSRVGMGPPPSRRGTPLSASTSSLSRSTSGKPRPSLPTSQRRSVSVMSANASLVAESDKENEVPVKTPARKSLVSA